MAKIDQSQKRILEAILRDLTLKHNITSLAKKLSITRMGIWKSLKKMKLNDLIILTPVGTGKTSAYKIKLNWENPLLEKKIITSLLEDALKQNRWRYNFKELENKVDFLILYGSILHSPKEAGDIDILGVVKNEKKFIEMDKEINRIQLTQIKKIHSINFTKKELINELIIQNNPAFIDAIEKGVVLFGQENFIKFIKSLNMPYIK